MKYILRLLGCSQGPACQAVSSERRLVGRSGVSDGNVAQRRGYKDRSRIALLMCSFVFIQIPAVAADASFVQKLPLPDGRVVVVAEGDPTPGSISCYSLQLFRGSTLDHPTNDLISRFELPYEGTIAAVVCDATVHPSNGFWVVTQSSGTSNCALVSGFIAGSTNFEVFVSYRATNTYFVLGHVRSPGVFVWAPGMTAWRALAKAGGPNEQGRIGSCVLLRNNVNTPVNIKDIIYGKENDYLMLPGDGLLVGVALHKTLDFASPVDIYEPYVPDPFRSPGDTDGPWGVGK